MNRWKENLGTKKRTGDGAARWARRIFCAFLIVIGCLDLEDGVGDAVRRAENRDSQSEGNVEQNLSGKSDSDASEPIWQPDFAALKCQNADVIAWIRIPGTHIDEPIVQTTDNESYRSIGLDGKPDPAGTVFLDCESAPDASDFHSIFYGHHMKDGSRFSELIRLKDEDFFQKHRTAYLYFPDGKRRTLRLIAALTAGSQGERRRTEFAVAPHLNTEKSCCHHVFLRHFRFQKCLPVNSYDCTMQEGSAKQINLQAAGKCGILLIVMRSAFF